MARERLLSMSKCTDQWCVWSSAANCDAYEIIMEEKASRHTFPLACFQTVWGFQFGALLFEKQRETRTTHKHVGSNISKCPSPWESYQLLWDPFCCAAVANRSRYHPFYIPYMYLWSGHECLNRQICNFQQAVPLPTVLKEPGSPGELVQCCMEQTCNGNRHARMGTIPWNRAD